MKLWNQQCPKEVLHAGVSAAVSVSRGVARHIRERSERAGDRSQEITHLPSPEDLWSLDEDDPLHEDMNEIG
jgi:hypothetical protein